jgi:hypothetical protein
MRRQLFDVSGADRSAAFILTLTRRLGHISMPIYVSLEKMDKSCWRRRRILRHGGGFCITLPLSAPGTIAAALPSSSRLLASMYASRGGASGIMVGSLIKSLYAKSTAAGQRLHVMMLPSLRWSCCSWAIEQAYATTDGVINEVLTSTTLSCLHLRRGSMRHRC